MLLLFVVVCRLWFIGVLSSSLTFVACSLLVVRCCSLLRVVVHGVASLFVRCSLQVVVRCWLLFDFVLSWLFVGSLLFVRCLLCLVSSCL